MRRLFISHSSDDVELARFLVTLLRASLNLGVEEIRCTSVDGYRLEGGVATDEQIRREVNDADGFIGIVSDASLRSTYVLFELGARWGSGKHFVPLLAPGVDLSKALTGPLYGITALRCDRGGLEQLIGDLAKRLELAPRSERAFQDKIDDILQYTPPRRYTMRADFDAFYEARITEILPPSLLFLAVDQSFNYPKSRGDEVGRLEPKWCHNEGYWKERSASMLQMGLLERHAASEEVALTHLGTAIVYRALRDPRFEEAAHALQAHQYAPKKWGL